MYIILCQQQEVKVVQRHCNMIHTEMSLCSIKSHKVKTGHVTLTTPILRVICHPFAWT